MGLTCAAFAVRPPAGAAPKQLPATKRSNPSLAALPVYFEPNVGQTDAEIQFFSRRGPNRLSLTRDRAVLELPGAPRVSMRWAGANGAARFSPQGTLPGSTSYFLGRNPADWRTAVQHYSSVRAEQVYPGIDLQFYGKGSDMEFDFIVQPGAAPSQIRLQFEGQDRLRLSAGNLEIESGGRSVRLMKPYAYQVTRVGRLTVPAQFVKKVNEVEFVIVSYDRTLPLIVDPVIEFSTFLGGTGFDSVTEVATDYQGNIYLTGKTASASFATAPVPTLTAGTRSGPNEVFVAKLNPAGTALLYLAILGGGLDDFPDDLALRTGVSSDGVWVTGTTHSTDFPTTAGSYHPAPFATAPFPFVFRLSESGNQLIFSTYLGNNGSGTGIGIGFGGGVYVSVNEGTSASVKVLNATGTALLATFGPYPNLTFRDISVENPCGTPTNCFVWITGDNQGTGSLPPIVTSGFQPASRGGVEAIVMLMIQGNIPYATYLGGSGDDTGIGISGWFAVAGNTTSTDFFATPPTGAQSVHGGGMDGFVLQIERNGTPGELIYGTYFGGAGNDTITSFDGSRFTGTTTSSNLPVKDAFQGAHGGGASDAFVAAISPINVGTDSLLYSSYFGGTGAETGGGVAGPEIFAGGTTSAAIPLTNPLQNTPAGNGDGFVARIAKPFYPFSCVAQPAGIPSVNAKAYTDLLGDILLRCSGGTAGATSNVTFQISSSGPLTSRVLNPGNSASEALLFVDEPHGLQQIGQPLGASVPGATVFQGVQMGNAIVFPNIPVVQPGQEGSERVFRFTNLRASGAAFAVPVGQQGAILATLSATGLPTNIFHPTPTLGIIQHGTDTFVRAPNATGTYNPLDVGCAGHNPTVSSGTGIDFTVRFEEKFPHPFHSRHNGITGASADPAIPPTPNHQLGLPYQTMSGLYNPTFPATNNMNQAGLAQSGARFVARFSNVPAGVRIWVTTSQTSSIVFPMQPATLRGFLTATDGDGAGAYSALGSTVGAYREVPISGGTGMAVWEAAGQDSTAFERIAFGVVLSVPPLSAASGQIQVGLALGPFGTAQTPLTAGVPRYESAFTTFPVATVQPCGVSAQAAIFRSGLWVNDLNGNGQWDGPPADRFSYVGQAGDVPVTGDWSASGRTKLGIFRDGLWVLDVSGNGMWDGPVSDRFHYFGKTGDTAVTGDWNGDGRDKIGVFRDGVWMLDYNGNGVWDGPGVDRQILLGQAGDKPVVGDWNGDGRTKAGIFRAGLWVLDYNGNGVWDGAPDDRFLYLGQGGDTAFTGDWNGDGRAKAGIFRAGLWVLDYNGNGLWDGQPNDRFLYLGQAGDNALVGDWNGDGRDKAGVFRNGLWIFDKNGNGLWDGPPVDLFMYLGQTGDTAVPGKW